MTVDVDRYFDHFFSVVGNRKGNHHG
jgi:hypothetical protein